MINKLLVPFLFLLSSGLFAQGNLSPYSSYGLGERGGVDHPLFSGMGNNTVNYISSTTFNRFNPASYSYIRPHNPIFSVAVSSKFSTFSSSGTSEKSNLSALSEIGFGVSFLKRFGFGFGLTPYYKRGYSFSERNPLGSDSVNYDYIGTGDISRAFFGLSAHILNYDSLKWTVGANLSSVFGTVRNTRRAYLVSNISSVGGIEFESSRIKSFHYEIGTVITKQFKGGHSLTLAGTFEPLQELNAYQNTQLFYSATDVTDQNSYVLISQTGEQKGKLQIAPSYTVGFDYTYSLKDKAKESKVRNSEFKLLGSFNLTDWSKFETRFNDTVTQFGYPSASGFNIGFQYRPETDLNGSKLPNFFERVSYRVGFYQKSLPYQFNNVQLTEFGTSFGLGIPILTEKTESSIQFGITYGQRGTKEVGSLNESFIGLNVGIVIAPSLADRWFIRRKLD